jgi:hypothetical protein
MPRSLFRDFEKAVKDSAEFRGEYKHAVIRVRSELAETVALTRITIKESRLLMAEVDAGMAKR